MGVIRIPAGGGMDITTPSHLMSPELFRWSMNFRGFRGEAVRRKGMLRLVRFDEEIAAGSVGASEVNPDGVIPAGSTSYTQVIPTDIVQWEDLFYIVSKRSHLFNSAYLQNNPTHTEDQAEAAYDLIKKVGLFGLRRFPDGRYYYVDIDTSFSATEFAEEMKLAVIHDALFCATGESDGFVYDKVDFMDRAWTIANANARKWGINAPALNPQVVIHKPYLIYDSQVDAFAASSNDEVFVIDPYMGWKAWNYPGPKGVPDGLVDAGNDELYRDGFFRYIATTPSALFSRQRYKTSVVVESVSTITSNAGKPTTEVEPDLGYPEIWDGGTRNTLGVVRRVPGLIGINQGAPFSDAFEPFGMDDFAWPSGQRNFYEYTAWSSNFNATTLGTEPDHHVVINNGKLSRFGDVPDYAIGGAFADYCKIITSNYFYLEHEEDLGKFYVGQELNFWNSGGVKNPLNQSDPQNWFRMNRAYYRMWWHSAGDENPLSIVEEVDEANLRIRLNHTRVFEKISIADRLSLIQNNLVGVPYRLGTEYNAYDGGGVTIGPAGLRYDANVWCGSEINIFYHGVVHKAIVTGFFIDSVTTPPVGYARNYYATFHPPIPYDNLLNEVGSEEVKVVFNRSTFATEHVPYGSQEEEAAYTAGGWWGASGLSNELDVEFLDEDANHVAATKDVGFLTAERFTGNPIIRFGVYGSAGDTDVKYSHGFLAKKHTSTDLTSLTVDEYEQLPNAKTLDLHRLNTDGSAYVKVKRQRGSVAGIQPAFVRDTTGTEQNLGDSPDAWSLIDHSPPPPFSKFFVDKYSSVWGWRGNELYWSSPDEPEYFPKANTQSFYYNGEADNILAAVAVPPTTVALNVALDAYVFTENTVRGVSISPDDITGPAFFELPESPKISGDNAVAVKNGVAFYLSEEGIFALEGFKASRISAPLDVWFEGPEARARGEWANAKLSYYKPHNEIHCMVSLGGSSGEWDGTSDSSTEWQGLSGPTHNITLAYSLDDGQWRLYQQRLGEYGDGPDGIGFGATFDGYVRDSSGKWYGWTNWLTIEPGGVTPATDLQSLNRGGLFQLEVGNHDDCILSAPSVGDHYLTWISGTRKKYFPRSGDIIGVGATNLYCLEFNPASFDQYCVAYPVHRFPAEKITKDMFVGESILEKRQFSAVHILAPVQSGYLDVSLAIDWAAQFDAAKRLDLWKPSCDLRAIGDADIAPGPGILPRILFDDPKAIMGRRQNAALHNIPFLERNAHVMKLKFTANDYITGLDPAKVPPYRNGSFKVTDIMFEFQNDKDDIASERTKG